MDREQMNEMINSIQEGVIKALQKKLDSKFDEAIQKINNKATNNEISILNVQEEIKTIKENMDNITAKVETDNEQVVDNLERIDNIDKNMKCYELRLKETEKSIDEMNSNEMRNPRLDKVEKELKEIKEKVERKSYAETLKENVELEMGSILKNSVVKIPPKTKTNIEKMSPETEIFREARGKIGLYPNIYRGYQEDIRS